MMMACVAPLPWSLPWLIWESDVMFAPRSNRFSSAQAGFSLIELMVSMVLGIIILFAVSELFVNNTRVRNELELGSRQIENGRYAVQLLTDDISNAGFFGESGVQPFPAAADFPPVCFSSEANLVASLGAPIFGEGRVAAASAPACLTDFKDGSSYLSLRRASTCAVGPDCDGFVANQYHLQVAACQSESPGTILLANTEAALNKQTRKCDSTLLAPRYRYLNHIYYVNQDDQLVRAELSGNNAYVVTPLVDGVERVNFEYGIDTTGDGVPDEFSSSPSASPLAIAQWEDVVVVRIWVLTRNTQTSPNHEDTNTYSLGDLVINGETLPAGFKRQVFSSTVRLNNIAGRRDAS